MSGLLTTSARANAGALERRVIVHIVQQLNSNQLTAYDFKRFKLHDSGIIYIYIYIYIELPM